jgi:plastocyanin
MNNDFRQRVFLPIILPVGVILGFFGFAFMLSRVLLAVSEGASTAIALGLAAYILAIAAIVSSRPRITSRALAVGVTLGVLAVVAAGLISAAAGMRTLEHGEEAAAAAGETGESGESAGAASEGAAGGEAAAGDALAWTAVDIDFEQAPSEASAGEQEVSLTNNGQAPHNVTIPKLGDTPVLEANPGETVTGTVTLDKGKYEFFCSVPGHQELMKGQLTVK